MCNHVRYLDRAGLLNRFYYAAKPSLDAAQLGLAPRRAVNACLKEYLVHGHELLLGQRATGRMFPLYHDLWQRLVLRHWSPARILHFLLHGNCLQLISRARRDGALVLGEPVNSHPNTFVKLINEEHRLLGIAAKPLTLSIEQRRMIDEAARADQLLTGSQFIRQSYIDNGHDPARIRVIPYGVDLHHFRPLTEAERAASQRQQGMFRVICVAQIVPRKGHIYLLEAWKRLKLPASQAELLLIGVLHENMRPLLARYADSFRHIPRVPHQQLREYYARSSVFVLPSVEDGFAYVVAEAMACGLPVITTHNTGAADLVSDGMDGFIVPIRCTEAIAQRLQLLYDDRALLERMGSAALAKSRRQLSWENYAQRLIQLYRAIANDAPAASRNHPRGNEPSPLLRR
ncbi:glycosyltransferase family 4 protein [Fontivita pretiosa]|uniref:glycosyltransferase family 4 protein n=1 Tax=Fontivita pretiosa TaxID=2989684 RepID=UPI003D1625A1